jgi:cytosine/adenosine deaminase-related metal-dependent hydrolase
MSQPLHIKGAQVWDGTSSVERDLYIKNGRIVTEKPNHAVTVDLEGYTIFPGLINAHDHLELNHFPRTKFREVYDNAHQWGEDVNEHLNDEPFKTLRNYPLWDRVFIGGLKNLLCGATTVVHHGPPHKPMYRKDFPVRVLKNYGWAHSLHFNTEEEIVRSYQSTPKNYPWFIHLAEGIDEVASGEYQHLKKLGCVGENTVIVHGVGIKLDELKQDFDDGIRFNGIVVCSSTNLFLLQDVLNVSGLDVSPEELPIALGSDSRLTALGDLSDEVGAFCDSTGINFNVRVYNGLMQGATRIIRNEDVGHFRIGAYAHFIVAEHLVPHRTSIKAVGVEGIPQIGDPDVMAKFPHVETVACTLDGVEKRMNVELARQVHRCTLKEQGLEVDALPTGKRFIFF